MDRLLERISWDAPGMAIEAESMRRIEAEAGTPPFHGDEWLVARRLVHASADFSLLQALRFEGSRSKPYARP
jgi:precorrin-8X/cobalt-precorrin-8 methylmutase